MARFTSIKDYALVAIVALIGCAKDHCFAEEKIDPFDENRLSAYKNKRAKVIDDSHKICKDRWFGIEPHWLREKEYLENFNFKDLVYSGVVEADGKRFALIKTPNGDVSRVSVGNYLGKDIGQVRDVKEFYIVATEIAKKWVIESGEDNAVYYKRCSYVIREGYEGVDFNLPKFP